MVDGLTMTQELIANMMGVDREIVIEGALKLQNAGLISYVNGRIAVLDRFDLVKRACECYSVITAEYTRLLPPTTNYIVTNIPTPAAAIITAVAHPK